MEVKVTPWYEAYENLAHHLNQFYIIHLGEAGTKLFDICINSKLFCNNNKWINKFSSTWEVTSLDPLHVFASISGNSSTPEKRLNRINILLELLQDKNQSEFYDYYSEKYSKIDVTGCPAPMPVKLLSARHHDDQNEIWTLFHHSFEHGREGLDEDLFSLSKQWYGVSETIITILLFWIKPNSFLPLDKNTLALLQKYGKITKFPKSVDEYKELLISENTSLYKTLTLLAYSPESFEILPDKEQNLYHQYIGSDREGGHTSTIKASSPKVTIDGLRNKCRLISLRPLAGCNPKFLKSLKINELYKLYQNFSDCNDELIYDSEQDEGLYDVDNLKVNVSAIVGKNGTGKSTLIELFIIAFNNLAYSKLAKKDDSPVLWVEGVNLEFFFETDNLYKVIIQDTDIKVITYKLNKGDKYRVYSESDISDFELDNLFYTTLINYSLHGLNSESYDEWLDKLFHKNDAYQTPIVIEPLRKKGIIDINRQDILVKQRLLVNLLEPEDADDDSFSLRYLKNNVKASHLKLSVNQSKFIADAEKDSRKSADFWLSKVEKVKVITTLFEIFEVKNINVSSFEPSDYDVTNIAQFYIVDKLYKIAYRYTKYNDFCKKTKQGFIGLTEFIYKLKADHSHITYKLRQAVNFLKFNTYPQENWGFIDIEKASNILEKILSELQVVEPDSKLDYLLPPPFLNVHIFLNNDVEFSGLSSGEKQKIYSINSILYHLRNIDSVTKYQTDSEKKLYKYNYVNIFLDEVELCFHPELQRTFISDLRKSLSKCFPNWVYGVNLTFVTHSPFILSDIPKQNILFLDTGEDKFTTIPFVNNKGTFAANIHDLLNSGFFMGSSIGAFAESVITEVISFHHDVINTSEPLKFKGDFLNKRHKFILIRDAIGDEYIKGVIKSHLKEIELELGIGGPKGIDDEISLLEEQLAKLKMEKEIHA